MMLVRARDAESSHLAYLWRARSSSLKVVTVAMMVALVMHIVAIATDYWMIGPEGESGLFTRLSSKESTTVEQDITTFVGPILGVVSAVILAADNVLNIVFLPRRFYLVMPAVIVFVFIAGLMLMTVMVTWSVPHLSAGQRLSWSFLVAALVVVLEMATCGLCIFEFMTTRGDQEPVVNGQEHFLSQLEESTEDIELQEL